MVSHSCDGPQIFNRGKERRRAIFDAECSLLERSADDVCGGGGEGPGHGAAGNPARGVGPPGHTGAALPLLDHSEATPDDLMQFVTGPDFPTGGLIMGRAGILDAYRTGKGSIRLRARTEIV